MTASKPSAAPSCWGSKYQDGDDECRQCHYNDSCRNATLARLTRPDPRSLPVYGTNYAPSSTIASLPPKSYAISTQVPPPRAGYSVSPSGYQTYQPVYQQPSYTPSATPPTPPPTVTYSHTQAPPIQYQNTGPNPNTAMHRPGVQSPSYYMTHYPGETVATRIGKNILLRGLEAVFQELLQFFRHWTWPPTR